MSERKKIHRLEPKKRPEVQLAQPNGKAAVESPLFQKQEVVEECVEEHWNEATADTGSRGRKWLLGGLGVLTLFFIVCAVWATVMLSSEVERSEVTDELSEQQNTVDFFAHRKRAVESYFKSTTVEEKSKLVRNAERVTPLMREHYSQFPLTTAKKVVVKGESPSVVGGKTLWQVHADVDYERVILLVETDPDGASRIDWELAVVHQPTDLEVFRKSRSTIPKRFRVLIRGAQIEGFHGFEFADYNKYRCYKVTIPNRDENLWAYTEVGSPLDRQWLYYITSGNRVAFDQTKDKAVILELSYPASSQSDRCVHLGKLLQAGWLHSE